MKFITCWIFILLGLFNINIKANKVQSPVFLKDEKIALIAQAYAKDAIDVAKNNFQIVLDWSDESIKQVEYILDQLYKNKSVEKPSEEQIYKFAKIFGSYVGEVFRINHKADWGMVKMEGEEFPGLQAAGKGTLFWPWGRVQNRIENGAEDNLVDYYFSLTRHISN